MSGFGRLTSAEEVNGCPENTLNLKQFYYKSQLYLGITFFDAFIFSQIWKTP